MPWTPVSTRTVPLIICGPILRRVDPTQVNVWVALSKPDTVTLTLTTPEDTLIATSPPTAAATIGAPAMDMTPPGHLFVALLTAKPDAPLSAGQTYVYNLSFASGTTFAAALGTSTLNDISYMPAGYTAAPSFSLPPTTLSDVHIAHASCRKVRGQSVDALPVLDRVLNVAAAGAADVNALADARLHQLVLTGDQFYADDVAPQFLAMCIDAASWLMGAKTEPPPTIIGPLAATAKGKGTDWVSGDWDETGWLDPLDTNLPWAAADPWPGVGERGRHMYGCGFTVTPPTVIMADKTSVRIPMTTPPPAMGSTLGCPEDFSAAANHLMLLGEFYASSLLSWSPALWPLPFTTNEVPTSNNPKAAIKATDVAAVTSFAQGLSAVRRVLANVPTYMILDDHDVCDDWYMNREWCNRVLSMSGNTLGRRVVRNALIAYAICQAWGNTPEQFTATGPDGNPTPGATLLAMLAAGTEMTNDLAGATTRPTAADLVGMPRGPLAPAAAGTTTALVKQPGALTWNYRWAPAGWPYELIVLDCRTTRGYLRDSLAPPLLLDDGGLTPNGPGDQTVAQIPRPDIAAGSAYVTIVVVQTPLLGMTAVDAIAGLGKGAHWVFDKDAEAWSMSPRAREALLARLVEHNPLTIALSGDVHYSFGMAADYWAQRPWRAPAALSAPRTGRVVQLVSSSARNQEGKTKWAHRTGPILGERSSRTLCGWNSKPALDPSSLGDTVRNLDPDTEQSPELFTPPVVLDTVAVTPAEWKYRLRPVSTSPPTGPAVTPIAALPVNPSLLAAAGAKLLASISDAAQQLSAVVIGNNNVSVVSFTGTGPADWAVTQSMYTRPDDETGASTQWATVSTIGTALQYVPDTQW